MHLPVEYIFIRAGPVIEGSVVVQRRQECLASSWLPCVDGSAPHVRSGVGRGNTSWIIRSFSDGWNNLQACALSSL